MRTWRCRPLGALLALTLAGGPAAVPAQEPLYLMFPYDYLGLPPGERRHYVLGVTDSVLTDTLGKPRHQQLSECLTRLGLDALLRVVEEDVIPQPNFGGVPMTFVVRNGLDRLCPVR